MKINIQLVFLFIFILVTGCTKYLNINNLEIKSPSKNINIKFYLNENGEPSYLVSFNEKIVIDTSTLGFEFKNQEEMKENFAIFDTLKNMVNKNWEMPWGEQRIVNNHYNELIVKLQEKSKAKRQLNIHFRAYNDGIAFRYEFPKQNKINEIYITEENTNFKLTEDHTCWWIPGDWDSYEYIYNTNKFSEINALEKYKHPNLIANHITKNAVNTPLTMRTKENIHLSFHEANLTNYSGMTLEIDPKNLSMRSDLVGSERLGCKAKVSLPFKTPWRTIQISENAIDLIASKLILNLNEPNKIDEIDWFKPMKYLGIWWEIHTGRSSFDYGMVRENNKWIDKGKAHGRHGATTKNAKKYIDFAAKNGIEGLLIEGWNIGWERWIGFEDREGVFDFITPYPDYNLPEVAKYAKKKGISLIMHHETSAAINTYEKQMDTAFILMKKNGINLVKTGYVGSIIPTGEYHHGQWMVNHYRKVIEKAAQYNIAVNAHEPIKPTGIRRTYPNAISREGVRGQEFNAWSSDGGNPPEHLSIVAFTRMLAGPIDYTPGVFDIYIRSKKNNRVNTTLAHQLALYVVIYSPLQMACDLPIFYRNHPAFQFIKDVGVDWEQSLILDGEVGDFVTIARQEKHTKNWYIGSITDENKRSVTIKFNFLDSNTKYSATVYRDGKYANWKRNPLSHKIENLTITKKSVKSFRLAEGGGLAISIKKLN